MRKLISVYMAALLCLTLSACGGSAGTSKSDTDSELASDSELALEKEITVDDYATFTLFKIMTTDEITASIDGNWAYESEDGHTYIDIVIDFTNKSSEAINSDEAVIASAKSYSGIEYSDCLYVVETDNGDLNLYDSISPLSTARLHCAISVPDSESDFTLKLKVNGNEYSCSYSIGSVASSAKEIKVGDTVGKENYATMLFNGVEYTDDLLPSNTSGYYWHYEVENTSNTYLVVKLDITNYMNSSKNCDKFVGINALYMDKYSYSGFVVVEDEDKQGFSTYESISPLSTRHFYYLIEVPKTLVEKDYTLTFTFNGQEYTYSGK